MTRCCSAKGSCSLSPLDHKPTALAAIFAFRWYPRLGRVVQKAYADQESTVECGRRWILSRKAYKVIECPWSK
jgi:hypothetical protein